MGFVFENVEERRGEGDMKPRFGLYGRFLLLAIAVMLSVLIGTGVQAAQYNYPYPKVTSKKGLYVCPGMEEDALELGVRHATINLSVGDFMPSAAYRNNTHCIPFDYEGTTYWFAKNAIAKYDQELIRLSQGNVLVTAILLLPHRSDDLKYLIYPPARSKSANYYQWDMTNPDAVRAMKAIVTFFQMRYSNPSGPRIVGWIVGNEVNNSGVWNWAGNISIDSYMDLYAAQVAEVYYAARSVYANARIYMCLDHYWSVGNGSYWYAGKDILTRFAARMSARGLGRGTWCIAYHPYNISEREPNIMSSSSAVTNNVKTRIITMKNLKVLTKFVKKNYSANCRIILSEQGYSSVTSGRDTSPEQAKNVALAYYIAQQNNMIDALILHRQVDHTGEGERYGLYSSWGGENAAWQKPSWTAYKYADTTKNNRYTNYAAKQAKKISGKKVKKLLTIRNGKLKTTPSLAWTANYTHGFGAFGALAGFSESNGVYTLTHDYSRNPNVPWGMVRDGRINCRIRSRIGFGIYINNSLSGSAMVYLRLWSGSNRYFDAQTQVSCGVQNYLIANLKQWKARNNITRVEILIRPAGGGWTSSSAAQIFSLGTRK